MRRGTGQPPPWAGDRRAAYVVDAARRIYVGGGFPNLHAAPELFLSPCPRSIYVSADEIDARDGSELHAIGVYQGRRVDGAPKGRERTPQPVDVVVAPTPRSVDLFLMSYDPVLWRIAVEPSARLGRIFLSSHYPSAVESTSRLRSVLPIAHGPHAYRFEPGDGSSEVSGTGLLRRLAKLAGREPTSFQGEYDGERFRVPFYLDPAIMGEVLRACRGTSERRVAHLPGPFWAVHDRAIVRCGSRDQPIRIETQLAPRAVAFCAADQRFYVIDDHALYAVSRAGVTTKVAAPREASWLGGIAYDEKRRRLLVTTLWHTGFHHLYDPLRGTWQAVPIGRSAGGLMAIAYEPSRDRIYALGDVPLARALGARPRVRVLSPELEYRGEVEHSDPLPFANGRTPGDGIVQMAAFAAGIVLVTAEDTGEEAALADLWVGARVQRGVFVRLDRDEIQRLDLGEIVAEEGRSAGLVPRFSVDLAEGVVRPFEEESHREPPDSTDGAASRTAEAADRYGGSVTLAELEHEAPAIVRCVAQRDEAMLVHGAALVMLVRDEAYHGMLARLAEAKEEEEEGT